MDIQNQYDKLYYPPTYQTCPSSAKTAWSHGIIDRRRDKPPTSALGLSLGVLKEPYVARSLGVIRMAGMFIK